MKGGKSVFIFFLLLLALPVRSGAFDLVLDPGHSPGAPGSVSCSGVSEFRFNNDLVDFIAQSLKSMPEVRVSLSKGYLSEVSLLARVKGTEGKNLFLSVHHDSVQPQFMTKQGTGEKPFACSDKASGFSLFVSRKNPHYAQSLAYARRLGEALVAQKLQPALHHAEPIPGENRLLLDTKLGIYAFDDLVVLKGADCPAVLLEAGVIVNPGDEDTVVQKTFREKVAQGVRKMIAPDPL